MERAERLIALGFGLLFHQFLVPILWLMLGLTLLTAAQRFLKVWKQATAENAVLAAKVNERRRERARRTDRRVARSTARRVRRRSQMRLPR